MRRKLRALVFSTLLVFSLAVAWFVGYRLKTFNERFEEIKSADNLVIEQLKKIRLAQKVYLNVNKQYAPTWDTLVEFIGNGEIPLIQTHEEVITLANGQDSISIVVDTLAIIPAYDSLNSEIGLQKSELNKISQVPISNETFTLYTAVRKGEYLIEVKDPAPINPKRQEGGKLKPLRFGSKAAASTKGNWE